MTTGIPGEIGGGGLSPNPYVVDPTLAANPTVEDVKNDFGGVVAQLNSFLRGEISAAETYRMAMDKLSHIRSNSPAAYHLGLLREVQAEHGRAAQSLRDRIRELGGEASDSSGTWGAWAKFAEGVASIFGETASLKALREGEELGLKDYER